ncbi:MAG: hypothetical protein SFU25_01800 [Candidatus Caenarcaniphilales bacterium]|nr:hypothetical protein [Candidatus Caenarcaniphilales bacterium]
MKIPGQTRYCLNDLGLYTRRESGYNSLLPESVRDERVKQKVQHWIQKLDRDKHLFKYCPPEKTDDYLRDFEEKKPTDHYLETYYYPDLCDSRKNYINVGLRDAANFFYMAGASMRLLRKATTETQNSAIQMRLSEIPNSLDLGLNILKQTIQGNDSSLYQRYSHLQLKYTREIQEILRRIGYQQ